MRECLSEREMAAMRTRIGELLDKRGAKKTVVSELCGLRRNAIGEYINNEAIPTLESLIRISDHFGVGVDFLLGRENRFNPGEAPNDF